MHSPSLPGPLVALIAGLLLFGTKRLPEMRTSPGQRIREFKETPSPAALRRPAPPTISDAKGVTS